MKPLDHFYHIYADGLWKPALDEHKNMLDFSELYVNLRTFNIGIVGTKENREKVKNYIQDWEPFSPVIVSEAEKGFEQVTQNELYGHSVKSMEQGENPYILYAHTKGASSPSPINLAWRNDMTNHTIRRWREAVEYVDNYDVVGIFWVRDPHLFFAGTFWWSKASFISQLGLPRNDSRYDAESWHREIRSFSHLSLPGAPTWPYVHPLRYYGEYSLKKNDPDMVSVRFNRNVVGGRTGSIRKYHKNDNYLAILINSGAVEIIF